MIAHVTLMGRQWVPAPEQPSATFFRYLVELADHAVIKGEVADALEWLEMAHAHMPPVQCEKHAKAIDWFASRSTDLARDVVTRVQLARAACMAALEGG
jgi:hypothetical protein